MEPSTTIIAFIKGFEQCRLTAYLPTPNDVPTIGWGSTGPDIHLGDTWDQAKADARFASDLTGFAQGVWDDIDTASQNQFDAMVSLAYNIGIDGFGGSTVLHMHNEGNFPAAANAFVMWNKQGGQVLRGLTRRRLAEADIYRGIGA